MFGLTHHLCVFSDSYGLKFFVVNFYFSAKLKESDEFLPFGAGSEVLEDSAIFLGPSMLVGPVEKGRIGLSNIGITTSRAGVSVDTV